MAQHDMNIANQGFPATRADLNNALQALVSNSSGTSAPSTTFANQWWYDTTNNKMYIRNEANNAWIEVFTLDQTSNEWQLTTGVIQAKDGDGLALKTDDGTTRLFIKDSDGSIGIGTTSPDGPLHIETTGNETQLTLESTDADATTGPNMTFYRSSASPADNDQTGSMFFIGKDDGGTDTTYASLSTHIVDATDGTEDGRLTLSSMAAGTPTETLNIVSGNVGIGTADIDVSTQAGGSGYKALQIESNDGGQLNFDHPDAGTGSTIGQINFQRAGEVVAEMEAVTDGTTDSGRLGFRVQPNGGSLAEAARIDHDGEFMVGTTSSTGGSSNFKRITGGHFTTKNGVTSIASTGVATTLHSFASNAGNFIVSAMASGTGNIEDNTTAIVHINASSTSKITTILAGSRVVLSMSGTNLQVTQNVFGSANITWSVMRIR